MSNTTQRSGGVRLAGLITMIAGAFMLVAGGVTWGAVSVNLANEDIKVADDASFAAGTTVDNPISAFAQADIINHHALDGSGGETYATLGGIVAGHKAAAKEAAGGDEALGAMIDKLDIPGLQAASASQDVIEATTEAAAAQGKRTTMMNASFLRASLFTSVVAFGVAVLVMGLGLLFILVGWALRRLATGDAEVVVAAAPAPATA